MSEQKLVRSLWRLGAALGRVERLAAGEYDVTVSQLRVLIGLLDLPEGAKVSDLAARHGLDVSTMTRNLALSEKRGWLMRASGEDRRTCWFRLTPEGVALARRLQEASSARLRRAISGFHPTERVERLVALDRVVTALERTLS